MADIRETVKDRYGKIAEEKTSCCGPGLSCCGSMGQAGEIGIQIGYTADELKTVPGDSNLGLGCGNPTALASLAAGEVVLDLGSGGGLDCFLAASKVGDGGRVIGVDMTPEMIRLARKNAAEGGHGNVEFRLGEIEKLPVESESVDVIISNCVINLSPDKKRTFREAFRVLRPGGRLAISDTVLLKPLPEEIRQDINAYVGCVAGALLKQDYLEAISAAGFRDIQVLEEKPFNIMAIATDPVLKGLIERFRLSEAEIRDVVGSIASIQVEAGK
jgi:arsenite methyltransferase